MSRRLKEPLFDDQIPEWTEENFALATHFEGGIKVPVSLRLSADVVKHFKDTGPGWQTRIDAPCARSRSVAMR